MRKKINTIIRFSVLLLIVSPLTAYTVNIDPCLWMESSDDVCEKIIKGTKYKINTEGIVKYRLGEVERNATLKLPKNFYVENVKYAISGNNIVFNFGITDAESGSAIIAKLIPQKSKFIWQTELGAFNASELLVENQHIYVAAIGTVAKINNQNGHIVWRHNRLYEKDTYAFNSFKRPKRVGKYIIFMENKTKAAKYSGVKEIVVDDESGEIQTHNKSLNQIGAKNAPPG